MHNYNCKVSIVKYLYIGTVHTCICKNIDTATFTWNAVDVHAVHKMPACKDVFVCTTTQEHMRQIISLIL